MVKEKIIKWKSNSFLALARSMTPDELNEMKQELLSRKYAIPYDETVPDYKERITYDYMMMLLYEADYSGSCYEETDKVCDFIYNMN